ncbi:MAG TPA: thioredoxin family protein [Thermoanaerobaculia bacterium]|nr:thioredoxin family protein [Thermoanaerobaculia bacterium]
MRRIRYALALAAAASLGLVAAASAETPSIGAPAPEIKLTTLDGKPFTLSEAVRGKNAVVVIFIATKCPYSNAYNDRLRDMAIAYGKQGVLFVGINSNKSEPAEEVGAHGKQHGFTFPLMKDPDNKVADFYDARHTPEVFVVDGAGKLRYHGRIDENYEDPARVTSPDLKNALDAMIASKPIARAETKAFGCSIKRV